MSVRTKPEGVPTSQRGPQAGGASGNGGARGPSAGVSGAPGAHGAESGVEPGAEAPGWQPRSPRLPVVEQLRERVLDRTAAWLADQGIRRIALYPAGRHSRAIVRQPWLGYGIEVVAVLDDQPAGRRIAGLEVRGLHEAAEGLARGSASAPSNEVPAFEAVVISSTEHEEALAERAQVAFAGTAVRVVGLYLPDDRRWSPQATIDRLVGLGVDPEQARWLVDNRGERHDALLPMLPAARTELHARRYELAGQIARAHQAQRVADVASGTGYGSRMLATIAGARVVGVDVDRQAVAYARQRHACQGRCTFVQADACRTGLPAGRVDLVASFETIEHVADAAGLVGELHRLLRPGGLLVISTPNRIGPTPYHVHDLGFGEFAGLIEGAFTVLRWIGQAPTDTVYADDLPPGMWPLDPALAAQERWTQGPGKPQFLIAVAQARGRADAGASAGPTGTTAGRGTDLSAGESGTLGAIVDWLCRPPAGS